MGEASTRRKGKGKKGEKGRGIKAMKLRTMKKHANARLSTHLNPSRPGSAWQGHHWRARMVEKQSQGVEG
jgi:hypothetical protein